MLLRFELHALGRPYHAARVRLGPRTGGSVLHGHADFHELMGVLSGRGEHLLEHGPVPLEPGDMVLVRPRDRHAIAGRGPDGLEFVNVAFPSSVWRGFCDLTNTGPAWERAPRPPMLRMGSAAAFEEVLNRFRVAPSMLDLVRFWAEVLPAGPVAADSSGTPAWLADACRAMRREENLRAGVPRLLELARVSPAHLARSMQRYYGVTPTTYVTDLRLEHAAALLAGTTQTVAMIAGRCGFSSQSYFTRRFTAAHRTPPTAFRRQAQRAFVP